MSHNQFRGDDSKYTYIGDKLVNERGQSVMMGWERPIMKRVAEIITEKGGRILNIGFGMGIVDTYIQEMSPSSHTIIERHPDVYEKMKTDGWLEKENVTVHYDLWQNLIEDIGTFDGIYLDTWYDDIAPFVKGLLDNCLKDDGVFSIWFNGAGFPKVRANIEEYYDIEFEYIPNDDLIPSKEEQYEHGGFYINPDRENVIIPIIRRKKNGR